MSKAKKTPAKFAVGDKVRTIYEVNGCPKMTLCEVLEIQNDGAIFKSKFLEGRKTGEEIRNAAADLVKA